MTADTKVILVDLDGTLAYYDTWHGPAHIGEPIPAMWHRVNTWLNEGVDVRIFTARLAHDQDGQAKAAIEAWCQAHFGRVLPITAEKDFTAVELWDDRAVQVEPNTGRRVDEVRRELALALGLFEPLTLSDAELVVVARGTYEKARDAVTFRQHLQTMLGVQARGELTDQQLLEAADALRGERDGRDRRPSSMGSGALRQGLRDMLKVAGLTDEALLEAVQGVQDALGLALRDWPIAQKPKKNGVRPSSKKTARRRAS